MGNRQKKIGHEGERWVGSYLEAQGFIIQAYNYRECYGEIDIIAHQHDMLLFVEVKVRRALYSTIADLIGVSKQRKIIKTAYAYVVKHALSKNLVYRFDVAVLKPLEKESTYNLTYIPNAFTLNSGDYRVL